MFLIEVLQIRDMLEIVGVKVAGIHNIVGLHIVLKHLDLQGVALLRQDGLRLLQDLRVGHSGRRHLDRLVVTSAAAAGQYPCRQGSRA